MRERLHITALLLLLIACAEPEAEPATTAGPDSEAPRMAAPTAALVPAPAPGVLARTDTSEVYIDAGRGFSVESPLSYRLRPIAGGDYLAWERQGRVVLRAQLEMPWTDGPAGVLPGEDPQIRGALLRAMQTCLADGPDAHAYCDSVPRLEISTSADGSRILDFDLREVEEWMGEEGTEHEARVIGPYLWVELPAAARPLGLLFFPADAPSLREEAGALARRIARSVAAAP